ncbi:5468_t:CDS:2 [Funneliformis geosporum]|uniref:15372_t:CDS:1 n=1 Tax=Funneliformis geosporum TaxID=1117311 RepID=A0A9W4T4M5_9GLOM|nr:15372_t:CDS:2 [Funneliformis geosporum]CAI2195753.1 5468_t:CDS:2 [Funneliformis geosporum]
MSLICKNIYECRQQIVYQPYLWSNDPDILECGKCDNCKKHEADGAVIYVFCGAKNANVRDKDLTSIKNMDIIKIIELKSWKEGFSNLVDSHYIIILLELWTLL